MSEIKQEWGGWKKCPRCGGENIGYLTGILEPGTDIGFGLHKLQNRAELIRHNCHDCGTYEITIRGSTIREEEFVGKIQHVRYVGSVETPKDWINRGDC